MLKIRRSRDRLIFNVGIPIPGKEGLYIETGPSSPIYSRSTPFRLCLIFIYIDVSGVLLEGMYYFIYQIHFFLVNDKKIHNTLIVVDRYPRLIGDNTA